MPHASRFLHRLMEKRIGLFPVAVLTFVIVAATFVCIRQFNKDTTYLEDVKAKTRLEQIELENKKSTLQQELSVKDTDNYIMNTARSLYGYLMPGEIRFQVTNIDDLYAEPEATVVEEGQ